MSDSDQNAFNGRGATGAAISREELQNAKIYHCEHCQCQFTVGVAADDRSTNRTWTCPRCGGNAISLRSVAHPADHDYLQPLAARLARAYMEHRFGPLAQAENKDKWIELFGRSIDLLHDLFEGRLGNYPPFDIRQP